jgi:SAM-dependent methyltransferase
MFYAFKRVARTIAPQPVRAAWGNVYGGLKIRRAKRAIAQGGSDGPRFLPADRLEALMRRGYRPPDAVRYDAGGLSDRAAEKIDRLAQAIDLSAVTCALELGSWDGMVGAALITRGIASYGLDIVMRGIDPRAKDAGVRFVRSDAGRIAFRDRSIDLVYSFGSLEHFPEPDRCLAEVARVVKPGGHVYLQFGPLYCSPYGRHAYRQIPVPFCHLLFREDALRGFACASGTPDDWPSVNGWTLRRYRALWKSLAAQFAVVSYVEHTTGGVGTELIAEYPASFREWAGDFDEFLVAGVEIVLSRIR